MKKIMPALLALVMMVAAAGMATAAPNSVVVVYHGTTNVNREAYMFLVRGLQQYGVSVSVTATGNPGTVKPGTATAVVVLNSSVSSGIDPVLKSFIDGYADKNEIFLVNLVAGSTNTTVAQVSAANNAEGVDAVTAASYWSERGSDRMTWTNVHNQWVQALANFIQARS